MPTLHGWSALPGSPFLPLAGQRFGSTATESLARVALAPSLVGSQGTPCPVDAQAENLSRTAHQPRSSVTAFPRRSPPKCHCSLFLLGS